MVSGTKWLRLLAAAAAFLLCAGCMYRGEIERRQANPAFVREEIARVEAAVALYYEARGVYPIKNSDQSTPTYEKYVVDLNRLVQSGMLGSIPANAFESGGPFYYLLVHPETEPVVKLMDVVAMQRIADVQKAVNAYASARGGALPLGAEVAPGFHAIDFDALGEKPVQIESRFTNRFLPLLLAPGGEVIVDYGLDIVEAADRLGGDGGPASDLLAPEADARELLVAASPFSPIRSFPYAWRNGEPALNSDGVR